MTDIAALTGRLRAVFSRVRSEGRLHARCLDTGREIGVDADQPVVLSSLLTVPVVLDYARQVDQGRIDPAERVVVTGHDRLGGPGIAGCQDDVELSLRDLAYLAVSAGDDTAADQLLDRLGPDSLPELTKDLDLGATRIAGGYRRSVATMVEDLGAEEFTERYRSMTMDQARELRACDPDEATASTPADLTRLLDLIWRDEAGPAPACAVVRDLLGAQGDRRHIAAGFPDTVTVAGMAGALPCLRNEVAVLGYPDGGRYAVAVSVATESVHERRPDVDGAIGQAARIAVDELRKN